MKLSGRKCWKNVIKTNINRQKMANKNAICWFEIYVDDIERAKKFYSSVLGISFQDIPYPGEPDSFKMSMFPCDPNPESMAVGGALVEMPDKKMDRSASGTIVYFPCKDCKVEESRVEAAGGKVDCPKMSIGEHGFCSLCVDTEGNTFGLYSME